MKGLKDCWQKQEEQGKQQLIKAVGILILTLLMTACVTGRSRLNGSSEYSVEIRKRSNWTTLPDTDFVITLDDNTETDGIVLSIQDHKKREELLKFLEIELGAVCIFLGQCDEDSAPINN